MVFVVFHFVFMDSSWWWFILFYNYNEVCYNKVWSDEISEMEVGTNYSGKTLAVSKSRIYLFFFSECGRTEEEKDRALRLSFILFFCLS